MHEQRGGITSVWPGEDQTYKTETKDPQRTDGMEEHTDTEHIHMAHADNQVIHKVANGQSLDQATGAGISKDTLAGGHRVAFGVHVHHP